MTPPIPPVRPDDNDPDWEQAVKAMRMGNPNPMIGYHLRPDDPYVTAFQSRLGRGPNLEESQHELGRRYDALSTSSGAPAVDQPTSGLRDPYFKDTPTPAERAVLNDQAQGDLRRIGPLEAAKRWGTGWIRNAVGVVRYPLDLLGAETRKIFGPTPAERANRVATPPPSEPTQAEILSGLNPIEQAKALGRMDPYTALGSIAGMATGGELLHAPFEVARVLDARRAAAPELVRGADAATLKTPAGEPAPVAAPVPSAAPGVRAADTPPGPDLESPTFQRRGGKVLPPVGASYEPVVPFRPPEPTTRAAPMVDRTDLNIPTYLRNLAPEDLRGALSRDPSFWQSEKGTATLTAMTAAGVVVPGSILGAIADPNDQKRGAAVGALLPLMLAGVALGGEGGAEGAALEIPSRYAKVDNAALQARHFEVLDRLQKASQEAGEGIRPWTRWDDDEHFMRSGIAVTGKAGRAIGRAKDDARILSEIEAEFQRRGVPANELLDRYMDYSMKQEERAGFQAETPQLPAAAPVTLPERTVVSSAETPLAAATPPAPPFPPRPPAPPTPPEPPSGPLGGGEPPRPSGLPTGIVSPDFEARIRAKFPPSVAGDVAARAVQVVQEQGLNPNRPVTWAETQAAADNLALDLSTISRTRALRLNAAELKATVDVVNRDARELADVHARISTAADDELPQLNARAHVLEKRMGDTESVLMQASSQKGRDLNILRKMAQDTRDPSTWLVKATRFAGRMLGDDERAQILSLLDKGSPKVVATYVQSLKYGTTTQGVLRSWVAGLISSPAIYGKAATGILTLTGLELAKSPVAAGLDALASGVLGVTKGTAPRTTTFNGAMVTATVRGFKAGLEQGLEKLGPGKAAALGATLGAATGAAQPGTVQERIERGLAGAAIGGTAGGFAGPALERIGPKTTDLPESVVGPYDRPAVRYDNPIMQGVDTYFSQVVGNSHGVYMSAAFRAGYERSIAEQVSVAKMNGMKEVPTSGTTEMQLRAAEYGAQMSLTSRTGPIASRAIQIKRAVGTPAIPIAVVPANFLERTAQYSPIGLAGGVKDIGLWVRAAIRDDPQLSSIQRQMVERLARGSIGTGGILAGYVLASRGLMTGSVPTDAKEREMFYTAGRQPWSIRVGKEWRAIGAVQGGAQLGIGAEIYNVVNDTRLSTGGKAAAGALAAGKLVAEQPFLQGPTSMVKAVSDPQAAQREAEQLAASLVPASGLVRHVAQASDSLQRAPTNIPEAVEAAIPGLRERVPSKIGPFGEELKRPGGAASAMFDFTRPTTAREVTNPVVREMVAEGAGVSPLKRRPEETSAEFTARSKAAGAGAFQVVKTVMLSPMYRGADIIARNLLQDRAALAAHPELVGMDLPAATRWLRKQMIDQAVTTGRAPANALTSAKKFLERMQRGQARDTTSAEAARSLADSLR